MSTNGIALVKACIHTEGKGHDCDYVNRRNRLIPEADARAYERMRAKGTSLLSGAFVREFFAAMDELAVESGLVSGGGNREALAA